MPISKFYLKGVSKETLEKEAELPREKRSQKLRTIYYYFTWDAPEFMRYCTKERILQCDWVEWDKSGQIIQRVNPKVTGADTINGVLEDIKYKVEKAEREIRQAGTVATLDQLESVLVKDPEPVPAPPPLYPSFYTLFLDRLLLQKKGKGRKNYEKCLYHLVSLDPYLTWQEITEAWFVKYIHFLSHVHINDRTRKAGILNGTIGKDVRVIKDICKKGRKAGAPVPMDYEDFKRPKYNARKDPRRVSITEDRFNDLLNFDFTRPELYGRHENLKKVIANILIVRDLYTFSFDTGLHHKERNSLLPDQVMDDVDDTGLPIKVIDFSRYKTHGRNAVPLTQRCLEMIDKYQGRQLTLLPTFCNQHFNRICKRMFKLAGFNRKITLSRWADDRLIIETYEKWQLLTAGTARHSAAEKVLDQSGDITLVRDMLGHESVVTTEIYAKNDRKKFNGKILKITEKVPNLKVS
jgi:integrase